MKNMLSSGCEGTNGSTDGQVLCRPLAELTCSGGCSLYCVGWEPHPRGRGEYTPGAGDVLPTALGAETAHPEGLPLLPPSSA